MTDETLKTGQIVVLNFDAVTYVAVDIFNALPDDPWDKRATGTITKNDIYETVYHEMKSVVARGRGETVEPLEFARSLNTSRKMSLIRESETTELRGFVVDGPIIRRHETDEGMIGFRSSRLSAEITYYKVAFDTHLYWVSQEALRPCRR